MKDWTPDDSDVLRGAGDLAVALAVCGYLVAAAVGLPLFEDGSFYFFTIVTEQVAVVPNLRFSAVLPQLPAVMAVSLGADLAWGRLIFSAAYMAIPLATLVGSWLLLRRRAPALLLLVLPSFLAMQLNFSGVSELLTGLYLTWPLLLAMLLMPQRRWVMVLAIVWGPLLLLLHPLAFIFCFGLGLVAWLLSWASGGRVAWVAVKERLVWRRIGLWLVANGLARLAWTAFGLNDYERGRLAPASALGYLFGETVAQHLLIAMLVCVMLLCVWVWHRRQLPSWASRALLLLLWLVLLIAAWVSAEYLLGEGIVLKSAMTLGVGLLGMAAMIWLVLWREEGRLLRREAGQSLPLEAEQGLQREAEPGLQREAGQSLQREAEAERGVRKAAGLSAACGSLPTTAMRMLGVALLMLLLAKSSAWWTGVRGLQDIVARGDTACIPFGDNEPYSLQWPWMVITDSWPTPFTALVTRPFVPTSEDGQFQPIAVMLKHDGCEQFHATGMLYLPIGVSRPFEAVDAVLGPLRPPALLSQ
ncbi:hypothetical protein [Halochromatium roseum]|uniref:hypothetical protein n=1 Tax=Halochromatium roseum TaxID=391920 RepID=UPI0019129ADB|nr:hypothetical protein [Halochromatium roseum]